jgi:hypothetical protein
MFYDPEALRGLATIGEPTAEQRFRAEYYETRGDDAQSDDTEADTVANPRLLRAQLFARVRNIF